MGLSFRRLAVSASVRASDVSGPVAVAPHPARPCWRTSWPCWSSRRPLRLVGVWLQGSGHWARPIWTLGAERRMLTCIATSCVGLCARGCMCRRTLPSGPCRLGLLVSRGACGPVPWAEGSGGDEMSSLGWVHMRGPWSSSRGWAGRGPRRGVQAEHRS